MNDNELITLVRESVADVHSTTPITQIISRGQTMRRRRRLARSAGFGVTGIAAAGALFLALTGVLGANPSPSTGAARSTRTTGAIQTVGFVLTASRNGTLSLTMKQMLDPAALQQALAQHGVPALVKTNSYCTSNPVAPDPFAAGVLAQNPPLNPRPGLVPAPGPSKDGPQAPLPPNQQPSGNRLLPGFAQTKTVINPAAMPAGTELFLGYVPGESLVSANLLYPNSYTCSSQPPPNGPKGP
jgi:hypothetical protein